MSARQTKADRWSASHLSWTNGRPVEAPRDDRVRLLCFPHAGGGASMFRSWTEGLADVADVWPIQLPGREGRWQEPALTGISTLGATLCRSLSPLFQAPFALFGHSMGSFVAFELARQLRRENSREPVALIVSAARAPQIPDPDPPTHHLAASELLRELKRLNGIPRELLDHPELLALLLPTLRADLALCETYRYADEPPLDCPIWAYGGEHDNKVPLEHLVQWETQTTRQFAVRLFPGDHFFVKEAGREVTQALSAKLRRLAGSDGQGSADVKTAGSDLKPVIAAVWRDVLGVPKVGLDDNFFDLGGNSMLMVQVYSKLREAARTELAVLDLFRYPTIRLLANAMGSQS
jgi:surfactin synthase thioesterase subunit